MKLYIKYFLVLLLTTSILSCEKFIGGEFNADPNNPASVPVAAQIPAIEIALSDVYGGDFSRLGSMLTQQTEGVARQWVAFNQYTGLTPNRFDDAWQNIYENILNEVQVAKATSTENGFNHYVGILQIIEGYTLMIATDVWDDMPYDDAFKGLESTNPAYNTQADIYGTIYKLLDDGIALLEGPSGAVSPGSEDLFFGGNTSAWISAAKATKARGLLHQKDYAGAANAAAASFAAASDNWAFQYPDANSAGNWFRFNRDREGDIEFHPTMRGIMTGLADTARLAIMDQTFNAGAHPYMVPDFLQEMITYREMQFIIAEADVRATAGMTQAGYDAMLNGIKASFVRLGLGDTEYDAYIASGSVPAVGSVTLEDVMTQKYIAMFVQPEVYSDWRRTGFPTLAPVSGTAIPVRWHYAADEYLFNSNAPDETTLSIFTDKVGWNQ